MIEYMLKIIRIRGYNHISIDSNNLVQIHAVNNWLFWSYPNQTKSTNYFDTNLSLALQLGSVNNNELSLSLKWWCGKRKDVHLYSHPQLLLSREWRAIASLHTRIGSFFNHCSLKSRWDCHTWCTHREERRSWRME